MDKVELKGPLFFVLICSFILAFGCLNSVAREKSTGPDYFVNVLQWNESLDGVQGYCLFKSDVLLNHAQAKSHCSPPVRMWLAYHYSTFDPKVEFEMLN